jgi:STE24 endopeptidase
MTERSFGDWLLDYGKGLALSAGVGVVILVGFYALLRWCPRTWWIWAGVLVGLLAVGFALVLPIWIEPLFNEFVPLREYAGLDEYTRTKLEQSIRDLAEQAGVPVQEVLVKDASRQGKHTNAYFTGFGPTRRIVLYDTLLTSHPEAEVVSVLGHEIGHWQHHHIYIGLALGTAAAFVGLFLLHLILRWAVNRRPFHLKSAADPAGWPLVLLLVFLASWLTMPVQNAISRTFERQADWTALELTGDSRVFIDTEKRFAQDNKMNLAPAPLSVWWFASHPPVVERIQMAKDWEKKQ